MAAIGVISFARLGTDDQPTRTASRQRCGAGRLTSVLDLPERLAALRGPAARRADRLLDVRLVNGAIDPPPELEPWLAQRFGSLDAVLSQSVLKVANLATLDEAIFAPLRSRRPHDGPSSADLAAEIASTSGDPFCHPETGTPAEPLGRVRGATMLTASNAAIADGHHAVLVFDAHDPLAFDAAVVADLLATGRTWAKRTHAADPAATAYLLLWNCLWRAGGSIVHGHAQALLGSGRHYAAVERFVRDAERHAEDHGVGLVADLVALHRDLDLVVDVGDDVAIVASLTPVKERELLVVGPPGMDERHPSFSAAITRALLAYRDRIGVRSFNLALWRRPLGDAPAAWDDIGPLVRLVDRGDPSRRASDIGAMELYGSPIVGSDPYDVIAALR